MMKNIKNYYKVNKETKAAIEKELVSLVEETEQVENVNVDSLSSAEKRGLLRKVINLDTIMLLVAIFGRKNKILLTIAGSYWLAKILTALVLLAIPKKYKKDFKVIKDEFEAEFKSSFDEFKKEKDIKNADFEEVNEEEDKDDDTNDSNKKDKK